MVIATALGRGEVEDLEDLLYANRDKNKTPFVEINKHFQSRVCAIGSWIVSVVDFDTSEEGLSQLSILRLGSEVARNKGLGQIVPDIIEPGDRFFNSDYMSVLLDVDSYTAEKLLHIGYTATELIPDGYSLEFVPINNEPVAQVLPFQSKSQPILEAGVAITQAS